MDKEELKQKLADAVADMRRLTLSRASESARDTFGVTASVRRAEGRLFESSRGGLMLQLAVYTEDGKVRHINIPASDAPARLADLLLSDFAQLNIATLRGDFEARRAKDGSPVITKKLPKKGGAAAPTPPGAHNREKNVILHEGSHLGFLSALGLADSAGKIFDKMRPKYRQINRFLEYLADVVGRLPAEGEIYALDLCCGKSYLTFAAYYYLTSILGRKVKMVGVDRKHDVIKYCENLAGTLGWDGLSFICGDIEGFAPEREPDLVLSLHACDTATDIVLAKAAQSGAKVILSTPCCQHELYGLMSTPPAGLDALCSQPLIKHKLTDAFTDALRVLYLEAYGYSVSAVELVDPVETPKNTLIRAVLTRSCDLNARRRYEEACAFLGVAPSKLVFDW